MSPELITILIFGFVFLLLFLGVPLVFSLGSTAIVFGLFLWGPESAYLNCSRTVGAMFSYEMIAVPLFMLMAVILEGSGLADDMYGAIHIWMGGIRGGLAVGTILICTAIAAMSGVSAAGVLTMGVLAFPAMQKRGYNKNISMGCIMAGGALGQLIPPSLLMVIYGAVAGVSVGKMFIGGILPGLMLSGLFIIYILVRSLLNKNLCPSMPKEERSLITLRDKLIATKGVILPTLLIVGVLGSIFSGIATPTEAAGVGAFGSMLCSVIHGRFTWKRLKTACSQTLLSSSMVMWIVIGSLMFVSTYFAAGGAEFVKNVLVGSKLNPWVVMICIQVIIIILGCLMDPAGIILLCTPLFLPAVKMLGFDPLWFGVLFIVNLEMAYLTPPFGYNLFYLKSIIPPEITMQEVYQSAIPFVAVQLVGLILCMLFPQIILYLPNLMKG